MGWWWSSSSGTQEPKDPSPPDVATAQSTPSPSGTQMPIGTPQPEKPLSRDGLAEAEFQAFLSELNQSVESSSSTPTDSASASTSSKTSTASSATANGHPSSIAPADLVPREMSCRNAFDYAWHCQSLGGQWTNVYRYGELRDCSERWSEFWFCMRTKSYPREQREKMIADFNRKKLDKYKGKPSSEDVWEMRTVPLRGAFQGDFEALEREMKIAEEKGIDS
ncbi:hypothetical protein VTO42DRAFT_8363 [Malbranchea cinnamomea]